MEQNKSNEESLDKKSFLSSEKCQNPSKTHKYWPKNEKI